MKKINDEAGKVLQKLSEGLKVGGSRVIDNSKGTFMPVHVEVIGKVDNVAGTGRMIAVAHYYEQNGDLVTDPEMVFVESVGMKGNIAYYPVSFEMGGMKFERSAIIEDGKLTKVNPVLNREHAVFAGKWMKNIKSQQRL